MGSQPRARHGRDAAAPQTRRRSRPLCLQAPATASRRWTCALRTSPTPGARAPVWCSPGCTGSRAAASARPPSPSAQRCRATCSSTTRTSATAGATRAATASSTARTPGGCCRAAGRRRRASPGAGGLGGPHGTGMWLLPALVASGTTGPSVRALSPERRLAAAVTALGPSQLAPHAFHSRSPPRQPLCGNSPSQSRLLPSLAAGDPLRDPLFLPCHPGAGGGTCPRGSGVPAVTPPAEGDPGPLSWHRGDTAGGLSAAGATLSPLELGALGPSSGPPSPGSPLRRRAAGGTARGAPVGVGHGSCHHPSTRTRGSVPYLGDGPNPAAAPAGTSWP